MADRYPVRESVFILLVRALSVIFLPINWLITQLIIRPLVRYRRTHFLRDVKAEFSYPISVHSGDVALCKEGRLGAISEYDAVTIQFDDLCCRLISGHGELRTQLAPDCRAATWTDLQLLQYALTHKFPVAPSPQAPLRKVSSFLQQNWAILAAAVSGDQCSARAEERLQHLAKLSVEEQLKVEARQDNSRARNA